MKKMYIIFSLFLLVVLFGCSNANVDNAPVVDNKPTSVPTKIVVDNQQPTAVQTATAAPVATLAPQVCGYKNLCRKEGVCPNGYVQLGDDPKTTYSDCSGICCVTKEPTKVEVCGYMSRCISKDLNCPVGYEKYADLYAMRDCEGQCCRRTSTN